MKERRIIVTIKSILSWGNNSFGQLGNGTNTSSNVPVPVSGLTNVVAIAAGVIHSLALLSDGTVWAWGGNTDGQLGNGTNTSSNVPVQVIGTGGSGVLTNVIAITAGGSHSLAILSDGTVRAWGANGTGQLGNGTNTSSNVPVQVSGLTNVVAIAAGSNHSLAILSDGTVRAWGGNSSGQLGNGTNTDSNVPVMVGGISNAINIAGGILHSLALLSDGTVRAWGRNMEGQLGNAINTDSNVPVQVVGTGGSGVLTNVVAISAEAQGFHSLALLSDEKVRAWGRNIEGQLGNGTNTNSNVPVQVSVLTNVVSITSGGFHNLALLPNRIVWAWGGNGSGQLGNGTNTSSNVPVQVHGESNVGFLTSVFAISAGGEHSLAIQSTPTISCPPNMTVSNDLGQCGAIVEYPPPTVSDECSLGFTFSCTPPSGSFFPVGSNTVTCTVIDPCGGSASCSFTVTVNDTEPPTITCPGNITVNNDPCQSGAIVNFQPPTASDNCGVASVTCSPSSGSFFNVGTTTVTCTATDIHGNSSTCTFDVIVVAKPLQQQIKDLINEVNALHNAGVLNDGQTNSLIVKLNAAIDSLNRGRQNAACNQLQAFINEVNDLINAGVLTPEQGQSLIDCATLIRNQIGCTP
ncbi:HYR domain-containing protein [Peribacillus simplex]|uniref:RCC1 domain-containing protein n=1 Tax=Peribacillus simplex TaxID=1478 RepID=UPI0036717578